MAVHVSGKQNVVSDDGSRDSHFAARWNRDPFRDSVLKHFVMTDIIQKIGPFDVDLFADREGISAQAPAWTFPEHAVFEATFTARRAWAPLGDYSTTTRDG